MKKHIALIALSAFLFLGCSQDGSNKKSTDTSVEENAKILAIGEKVTLNHGDRLVPTSDDARVEIVKSLDDNVSEVTLLRGEAKVIVP